MKNEINNDPSSVAEDSKISGIPQDVLVQVKLLGLEMQNKLAGNSGELSNKDLPQMEKNRDLHDPTLYGKGGGRRDR